MNWMKSWLFKETVLPQQSELPGFLAAGLKAVYGIGSLAVNLWAFLMLTVFPLYAPNQYYSLGDHKYTFFLQVSRICLLPAMLALLVLAVMRLAAKKVQPADIKAGVSSVDLAVLAYLAAAVLSFLCSKHKQEVWVGADGWFMGLRSQLYFGAVYFCASRFRLAKTILLAGHAFGSAAAFLLGVLHRFGIDPLGMYEGIAQVYHREFLSTLGQATWFSSYICTVLVIGVAYFYTAKKWWVRLFWELYCMLGFAAVATQNSDSAFGAMGVLFLGLFCLSCQKTVWLERFWETLLLMLGSFKVMGLLGQIFSDRAMQLDEFSVFMSQSMFSWIALLAVTCIYTVFLIWRMRYEKKTEIRAGKWLGRTAVTAALAAITGYVLIVWLNTSGKLPVISRHPYLFFDRAWGNYRGFAWEIGAKMFAKLPPLAKCFGVGPDGFGAYCYNDTVYGEWLNAFYGTGEVLTNVHNELFNTLLCMGIFGLGAFLAVAVTALKRYLVPTAKIKSCAQNDVQNTGAAQHSPLVLAGGLAVLSYCAHNFFCYQQVCCTPFWFLLLAIAENGCRYPAKAQDGLKVVPDQKQQDCRESMNT